MVAESRNYLISLCHFIKHWCVCDLISSTQPVMKHMTNLLYPGSLLVRNISSPTLIGRQSHRQVLSLAETNRAYIFACDWRKQAEYTAQQLCQTRLKGTIKMWTNILDVISALKWTYIYIYIYTKRKTNWTMLLNEFCFH